MKKNEIIEGRITRIDYPNKGVMETGEGRVVIKNALPGQVVRCRIKKARGDRAEGILLEVLQEAPDAVASPCPHFGICGGCTFLTVPYVKVLGMKEQQVRGLLRPALASQKEHYVWEGIKTSPVRYGYRNKMEFTFGDTEKDGPLALGMHRSGSMHDIVTVSDCCIIDEDYRRILRASRDYFGAHHARGEISFYHRIQGKGYLRHLIVRKAAATGEILVDLVTTTQEEHDLEPYVDRLRALELSGSIVGILHTVNDSVADVVKDEGTEILFGQDHFYEELLGLRFRITPFSFFQTNSYSAAVLYETVRDYVKSIDARTGIVEARDEGRFILDLYCGTGTISQILAPIARRVVGVELVPEAVEAAKENASMNHLDNCVFIAGDVLEVLDSLPEPPDLIILDPPRDGVHPKALKKIVNYGAPNLVYVSCKPTSLVRDLEVLLDSGYIVRRAVALDQFVFTSHVECCVLLQKSGNGPGAA